MELVKKLMSWVGTHIDYYEQNDGNFGADNLIFGSDQSGEGISSTRGSGTLNQFGLNFWTNKKRQTSITNSGTVLVGTTTQTAQLDVDQATDNECSHVTAATHD